jgi:hypothetical protein
MRAAILVLPILAMAGVAASGGAPAAAAQASAQAERHFAVGAFESIAVAGPYNVIVTPGRAHGVRASGSPAALDQLDVTVERGALRIGTQRGGWLRRAQRVRGTATIHVTTPRLASASIAGSGDMRIERVEARSFSASVAGSGDMDIGRIRAEDARFSIAGSGNIRAAGGAGSANLSIAGSGDMDLRDFETRTARVSVMGSGDVRLRATEHASVSVMGSGDVQVTGGARCDVNRRGSGRVSCG